MILKAQFQLCHTTQALSYHGYISAGLQYWNTNTCSHSLYKQSLAQAKLYRTYSETVMK